MPSISLTGSGTVRVKPDEGYINLSVKTVAHKSAKAVTENTRRMRALYKLLADKGVKEENIRTLDFAVGENWKTVYEKDEDTGKRVTKQVRDGYQVYNVISLTICELDKFGEVLDAVTAGEDVEIQGLSFGYSKATDALEEARKKAVADALRRAKTLTDGAGVKLGRVLSIVEADHGPGRRVYAMAETADRSGPGASRVPVSGGSLSFSVNVTIRWELDHGKVLQFRERSK